MATALVPELYRPALSHNGILPLFEAFASLADVKRGKGFPDDLSAGGPKAGDRAKVRASFSRYSFGISGPRRAGLSPAGLRPLFGL